MPLSSSQVRTPPLQNGDGRSSTARDTIHRYADDAHVVAEPAPPIRLLVPTQHVAIPFITVSSPCRNQMRAGLWQARPARAPPSCKWNMASTGEGPRPNHKPVRKVQFSPPMDPAARRNDCMKDHPGTSEIHECGGGNLKETRRSIAAMSPGEMEALCRPVNRR